MNSRAALGGATLVGVALLVWLLSLSVTGTMAFFTSEATATVSLTTGVVRLDATGLTQSYDPLLPEESQDRAFSFTNDGSAPIDVYLWLEPAGAPHGLNYCSPSVAPYLQLRITTATSTVVDWTSVCNIENTAARSGALAPVKIADDVPVDGQRDYTMSLRLHPAADDVFRTTRSIGDTLVLFAIQDDSVPLPAGPVGSLITEPAS